MTDITPARLRDLAAKHEWHAHGGPDNTAAALRAAADRIEQCVGVVGDLEEREQELLDDLAAREALLVRASDALDTAKFIYGTGDMERARALAAEIAEALGAPDAPP